MTTNPATRPFWVVVGSGIDVRGIDVLGQIFDFSGIEKSEKSIKKTWQEFRDALSKGDFSFDDIASAKKNTFLRVYDDLFNKNAGIEYNTVLISEIEKYCVGRGTILGEDENPDFERFIPKTEFIKEDNRFSPSGVEWLYLAINHLKRLYRLHARKRPASGTGSGKAQRKGGLSLAGVALYYGYFPKGDIRLP